MRNKRSLWVLEHTPGKWLFEHNPNSDAKPDIPPYHFGELYELARGHGLVHGETHHQLDLTGAQALWNLRFPQFKVKPRKIVLSWHYYNRPAKKGETKCPIKPASAYSSLCAQ